MALIESTDNLRSGQMLKHSWLSEDNSAVYWELAIVKHIFDDGVIIVNRKGETTWINIDNESVSKLLDKTNNSDNHLYSLLMQHGQPVMSKKSFFGKYTFVPDLLEV